MPDMWYGESIWKLEGLGTLFGGEGEAGEMLA
jgi:hypothetical protein